MGKITTKILAAALMIIILTGLTGCDNAENETVAIDKADFKAGAIFVGDGSEAYTAALVEGIEKAAKETGLSENQIVIKYSVDDSSACLDAASELVKEGCNIVITGSYSQQSYMQLAASELKNTHFVAMTGDTANQSKLPNFSNAFTKIYEARYISGVVAGMKIKELEEDGKLSDANKDSVGNIRVGYIGAFPYAEVVSGYTAFFLGVQSVVPEVVMEVQYTNSWFDVKAETEAAKALIFDGCVVIGQHTDSKGIPVAIQDALQKGTEVYSVGYNVDMLSVAPDAVLTSATNDWSVFFTYLFNAVINGEKVATDWAEGYETGAVAITELGQSCAAGTQEKVDETIAAIKEGSLHVFDTGRFTVEGKVLESYRIDLDGDLLCDDNNEDAEAIKDGYFHESELRSAPAFDIRIDGITEVN